MQKICAIIAIIEEEEIKSHGIVLMLECMLKENAKTVILTITIEKEELLPKSQKLMKIQNSKKISFNKNLQKLR